MGETRSKRAVHRTRTVSEDWLAWIPNEMGQLFDATRKDLETSNFILSMTIDEALDLCKGREFESAKDRVIVFVGLFERLVARVAHVIRTIKQHGSHFGTLPNVEPLAASNFRGATAQKVSRTNSLLAKVVFGQRSRFFHKLYSIDEIVGKLHEEMEALVAEVPEESPELQIQTWELLEVLSYDLTTCMGEATIILKSFFCALPPEELAAFREKLAMESPSFFDDKPGRDESFES